MTKKEKKCHWQFISHVHVGLCGFDTLGHFGLGIDLKSYVRNREAKSYILV